MSDDLGKSVLSLNCLLLQAEDWRPSVTLLPGLILARLLWFNTSKPIKMSSQESLHLPPKPEVKQRPPVPSKPSNNTSDTSSVEVAASQNSGNVKNIVNKFSQPEAKVPGGDIAKSTSIEWKQQRPPAVKPRRKTKGSSLISADEAPPLPPKTRQNHSGQKDEVESQERQEGTVDGGRSGTADLLSFSGTFYLFLWNSRNFSSAKFSHKASDRPMVVFFFFNYPFEFFSIQKICI